MPSKPRRKSTRQTKKTKLRAALAPALPQTVPVRWVKFIVGLFLLPIAWVLTQTFFTSFARVTVKEQFWATEEFWFFGVGVVIWLVAFAGLPRPMWIYVFGHELTHALWVFLMGGRVSELRVTPHGGHVLSDRINTWIALAPYFFPIYSLLIIAIYGLAGLFWDMTPLRPMLFMLIGASWAFHLTFTLWMIPKGQSDLAYGGTFYSLVIIYVLNLAVLSVFLVVASPAISARSFGIELLQNAIHLTDQFTQVLRLTKW